MMTFGRSGAVRGTQRFSVSEKSDSASIVVAVDGSDDAQRAVHWAPSKPFSEIAGWRSSRLARRHAPSQTVTWSWHGGSIPKCP